jgi:hypothetical protein
MHASIGRCRSLLARMQCLKRPFCLHRKLRHGANWWLWSLFWWLSLLLAASCPAILATLVTPRTLHGFPRVPRSFSYVPRCLLSYLQAKMQTGLVNLDLCTGHALTFDEEHPIHIPYQVCPAAVWHGHCTYGPTCTADLSDVHATY